MDDILCGCMDGPSDPDPACPMCYGTGRPKQLLRVAMSRVCPTCRSAGWVQNPDARYEMDYVDGYLATGVYSTVDPEEIDCPTCKGVGFVKPRKPAPVYQQVERDDGMPF